MPARTVHAQAARPSEAFKASEVAAVAPLSPLPARVVGADNAYLRTEEGAVLIDFSPDAGAGVTGHRHPQVVKALRKQLAFTLHTGVPLMLSPHSATLAARLEALAPITGPCRTLWATTGAEAIEFAVTLAQAFTGRQSVLAFAGGWHGETGLARSLSSARQSLGNPGQAYIQFLPFPHVATGTTLEDLRRSLRLLFRTRLAPSQVAAVVIECVQSEAGVLAASATLMHELRTLCDRHGIVLIVDETRTALARTGKLFAVEHFDIEPDLVAVSDGLSDGLPLAAVIGRQEIIEAAKTLRVPHALYGHAMATAAAHAVLDIVRDENLGDQAVTLGRLWMSRIQSARREHPYVVDARGIGAMRALEFRRPSGEPDVNRAFAVAQAAHAHGVFVSLGGIDDNVIRFQFPLTLSQDDLNDGLDRFIAAMNGLKK